MPGQRTIQTWGSARSPGNRGTSIHMRMLCSDTQSPLTTDAASPIRSSSGARPAAFAALRYPTFRTQLRELPSSRFRIVGTAHWVADAERARYSGQEYELDNEHDPRAVTVRRYDGEPGTERQRLIAADITCMARAV
jgi:hypothetical protein